MEFSLNLLSKRGIHALDQAPSSLFKDLRVLILETRSAVASSVNAELTILYWRIGRRVLSEILHQKRADYGQEVIESVGRQLEIGFGSSYRSKSIRHMVKFAEVFDDEKIVSALRRQLSWTHFKRLIYIQEQSKRTFYAELACVEGWSTRTLNQKIEGML